MIRLLAILALLMPGVVFPQTFVAGVTVGTITGTNGTATAGVAMVAPTPATVVMLNAPGIAVANSCWPTAGDCTTGVLGSLASTTDVWALVPPATAAKWVTVASITASAVPTPDPAPTPVPVATNNGTALLTWTAPTLNTDGSAITLPLTYNVYRGASATGLTVLNTSATLSFQDSGLTAGSTYFYAVTAVAGGIESAQSATVSTTTAAPAPVIKTPAAPGLPVVISPAPSQP